MDINRRFEIIIEEIYANNQRSFAKAIGVAPSVIANVVGARRGKPSFDVLVKVCANANISPSWLLIGEGEMCKTKRITSGVYAHGEPCNEPSTDNKDKQNIPNHQENNDIIARLLDTIKQQAEEIGQLKALIAELEKHIQQHSNTDSNSSEDCQNTAAAG